MDAAEGLDRIALQARMMQSLALEQPVPLDRALQSVGAEVEASPIVHRISLA